MTLALASAGTPSLATTEIRLIPTPLWGFSAAALCTGATWNRIRAEAEALHGSQCFFADDPGRHATGPLHGHERWKYIGDQAVLEDVWPVCRHCHDLFHPGRMLAVGGEQGLARITRFYAFRARISRDEAERRYSIAFRQHAQHSQRERWTIDLRRLSDYFPLKIKKSEKTRIALHNWIGNPFPPPS